LSRSAMKKSKRDNRNRGARFEGAGGRRKGACTGHGRGYDSAMATLGTSRGLEGVKTVSAIAQKLIRAAGHGGGYEILNTNKTCT